MTQIQIGLAVLSILKDRGAARSQNKWMDQEEDEDKGRDLRNCQTEVEMGQPYSTLEYTQVDKTFTGVATPYEQQISGPSTQKMGGRYQTTRRTWLDAKGILSPSMEGAGRGLYPKLDHKWLEDGGRMEDVD